MNIRQLIKQDNLRYKSFKERANSVSFYFVLLFRICTFFKYSKGGGKSLIFSILYFPLTFIYKFFKLLTGIQLPIGTQIEGGMRFFHYGCVVIAQQSKIGKNCSIHQGVTIGRVFNGQKKGVPTIGNNVVIFAGAKIVGNVTVGDYVVIGANSVVTSDIPEGCVCAGVPAKIISTDSKKCFDNYWSTVFKYDE